MGPSQRNKITWYRGIQFKITVTLLVVTTVILGGFAIYDVNRVQAQLNKRLEQKELEQLAHTTTERLAPLVAGPLWAHHKDRLLKWLNASMLDRGVHAIIIRDEDGKTPYVGVKRDEQGRLEPTRSAPQKNLVVDTQPLYHVNELGDRELIGVLEVYVTRHFLQQRFDQLRNLELGRLILLDLAIIVVTLLLLQRLLVRPIRRLIEATDLITAGELNTPIDIRARDEIGLLGDAIGKLQTSLRIAMDRMRRRDAYPNPMRSTADLRDH